MTATTRKSWTRQPAPLACDKAAVAGPPPSRAVIALGLLATAIFVSGCSGDTASESETFEIAKTYEQGPLRLDLKVEKSKISVADRLRVVLEATAPESEEVTLPERGQKLGEFTVAESNAPQPRLLEGSRVLHQRSYVLEPFLAGEYKIPPFTVRYAPKPSPANGSGAPAGQAGEPKEISTEEIPIEVASLLAEGEQQPQLKEIADPVDMPAPWWPWVAAAVAAAALLAGLLWWRRRKQRERDAVPPPGPHELAYQELEKLLAAGLLEKGESKLFYLRLSNILRHYIEGRFGLRAPEQTTEEFLLELRNSQPFGPANKERLQAFLEHCDLVKFAEMQPTQDEAETSVALCRRFIDETKHEETTPLETVTAK